MKNLFLILVLSTAFQSCRTDNCNAVSNFEIGELLLTSAREKSYDYCELLEKAVNKDQEAIKKLSLLEFDGAVGYDHGYVLVKLIETIGENNYLTAIQKVSNEEKGFIEGYLDVGLEYGNFEQYQGKQLKEVFPTLYNYLTRK